MQTQFNVYRMDYLTRTAIEGGFTSYQAAMSRAEELAADALAGRVFGVNTLTEVRKCRRCGHNQHLLNKAGAYWCDGCAAFVPTYLDRMSLNNDAGGHERCGCRPCICSGRYRPRAGAAGR